MVLFHAIQDVDKYIDRQIEKEIERGRRET